MRTLNDAIVEKHGAPVEDDVQHQREVERDGVALVEPMLLHDI